MDEVLDRLTGFSAAVYLSAGALAVSIWTAWATRIKRPRVRVVRVRPASFAGWLDERTTPPLLMLRFAIVIVNTGARNATVTDLKLSNPEPWRTSSYSDKHYWRYLAWDGLGVEELEAGPDDDPFAHPFSIDGHSSASVICRFRAHVDEQGIRDSYRPVGHGTDATALPMTLWIRTAHQPWWRFDKKARAPKWRKAVTFDFYPSLPFIAGFKPGVQHHAPLPTGNAWRVVHWNSPDGLQPGPGADPSNGRRAP